MHPRLRRLVVLPLIAVALTACGSVVSSGSPPSPPTTAPSSRPPSAASEPAPSNEAPATTQTDTEWGRIWDDLPAGFPRVPGSTPADDATATPVSGAYAIPGGDAAEIASWMQAALETATYSTEALSGPLEDGSVVIDSVGDGECRIQTVIAPMGELTLLTVRYGADCPNR